MGQIVHMNTTFCGVMKWAMIDLWSFYVILRGNANLHLKYQKLVGLNVLKCKSA